MRPEEVFACSVKTAVRYKDASHGKSAFYLLPKTVPLDQSLELRVWSSFQ